MNPLKELQSYGQSVWLDYFRRSLVTSGELRTLIDEDGLRGITSNPSIFEKAIGGSTDYDAALQTIEHERDLDAGSLYERLAVEDIQMAADALRPIYEATDGRDGFISIEVSPYLAMDTGSTVAEARRLWHEIQRDNVMIKVPATVAGLPAIRQLIGEGININITLLFSRKVYDAVAEAYLTGLENLRTRARDIRRVASVASFFVSRVDTAVDALLQEQLRRTKELAQQKALKDLLGKAAIANAKLAYRRYQEIFRGKRWENLAKAGAKTQRLLWASTGTKNPRYSDVRYVEELIGPDTINTMPPGTMEAFRHHGKPRSSLEEGTLSAEQSLVALDRCGVSLEDITDKLTADGVQLFCDAADKLFGAIARKRAAVLTGNFDRESIHVPTTLGEPIQAMLENWRKAGKVRQLWQRDANLWTGTDEGEWLGWLRITDDRLAHLGSLEALAQEVRNGGFSHAVLLGMGGSSLGPEVLATVFGSAHGHPALYVLDSTDPAQIRAIESKIDLARTLFIVSSKSGTTLEPNIFKQYFFERACKISGREKASSQFIAITDPGSPLEQLAEHDDFRGIYCGEPGIGGRYSVLSNFGMVPAAILGIDVSRLLDAAETMVQACYASVPPAENPGVKLGIILGALATNGRDKVTIIASPRISTLGAWLEQLIAESTGKNGRGLIPVDGEPLGSPEVYGTDRVFAYLRLESDPDPLQDEAIEGLARAGQPVVRISVTDIHKLGQEFFRWEMAIAVAGSIIGINPFDQPDVEASKIKTRKLTAAFETSGRLPPEEPFYTEGGIQLFADQRNRDALRAAERSLVGYLKGHLGRLRDGDYAALLAYIERNEDHSTKLQTLRRKIRDAKHVATCVGFGPRFLHSTGQAYKGGPNSGVFIQITSDDATDLPVPGQKYSFGIVKAAQARGDFEVLAERGRRALRVHIGADITAGLTALGSAMKAALL